MISTTSSLKTTLLSIHSYFQEHIQNDFLDNNERRCRRASKYTEIPNVITRHGSESMLIKDMQIMKTPNFKIKTLALNMNELFLQVSFEVEKLLIEGKFEMLDLMGGKPLDKAGNILFALDNVIIQSVIPIFIDEDSFTTSNNILLDIKPSQIITKMSWNVKGEVESSEFIHTDKDQSLLNSFYDGLCYTFRHLIDLDLGSSIVEYSVVELFADEPDEMKEFCNSRLELAEELMHKLIEKAKPQEKTIDLPDFNLCFKKEDKPISISLKKGVLSNILKRISSRSPTLVQETDKRTSLSCGLEIRDLTMIFNNASAKYENVENTGSYKFSINRTVVIFKAIIERVGESHSTKIEDIQFSSISSREVERVFTDLKCLDKVEDDVQVYLEAFFHGEITRLLIETLKGIFEEALKQCDLVNEIFT